MHKTQQLLVNRFFCNLTVMEMIPWLVQYFLGINLIKYEFKEKLVYQKLLHLMYIYADLLQKLLSKFPIFALSIYTPIRVLYPKQDIKYIH